MSRRRRETSAATLGQIQRALDVALLHEGATNRKQLVDVGGTVSLFLPSKQRGIVDEVYLMSLLAAEPVSGPEEEIRVAAMADGFVLVPAPRPAAEIVAERLREDRRDECLVAARLFIDERRRQLLATLRQCEGMIARGVWSAIDVKQLCLDRASLWACHPERLIPGELLEEVLQEGRAVLQSAGIAEAKRCLMQPSVETLYAISERVTEALLEVTTGGASFGGLVSEWMVAGYAHARRTVLQSHGDPGDATASFAVSGSSPLVGPLLFAWKRAEADLTSDRAERVRRQAVARRLVVAAGSSKLGGLAEALVEFVGYATSVNEENSRLRARTLAVLDACLQRCGLRAEESSISDLEVKLLEAAEP